MHMLQCNTDHTAEVHPIPIQTFQTKTNAQVSAMNVQVLNDDSLLSRSGPL